MVKYAKSFGIKDPPIKLTADNWRQLEKIGRVRLRRGARQEIETTCNHFMTYNRSITRAPEHEDVSDIVDNLARDLEKVCGSLMALLLPSQSEGLDKSMAANVELRQSSDHTRRFFWEAFRMMRDAEDASERLRAKRPAARPGRRDAVPFLEWLILSLAPIYMAGGGRTTNATFYRNTGIKSSRFTKFVFALMAYMPDDIAGMSEFEFEAHLGEKIASVHRAQNRVK